MTGDPDHIVDANKLVETDAEARARIIAAGVAKVASWPEWKRDYLRAQVEALGRPQWRQDKPEGRW